MIATMKTRDERQMELQALLATQDGMLAIIELYHQKYPAHGSLGRIGLLASQMIPRILDAEFPRRVTVNRGIAMRSVSVAALFIALTFTPSARAADEQQQARALIARAIKAHGGAERAQPVRRPDPAEESTGLSQAGQSTPPCWASISAHYPKRVMIDVENQYIAVIDGDHGWMTVKGQTRDLRQDLLDDRRDEQYVDWVKTLLPLRDKKFKLALCGDALVETKPATGLSVTWKDHRGFNLYFDNESDLLVKSQQFVKSQEHQGQEVTQEITILDYEDVEGIKLPHKTVTTRNGKVFLEVTRTDMKRLEKLDDSLFVKP